MSTDFTYWYSPTYSELQILHIHHFGVVDLRLFFSPKTVFSTLIKFYFQTPVIYSIKTLPPPFPSTVNWNRHWVSTDIASSHTSLHFSLQTQVAQHFTRGHLLFRGASSQQIQSHPFEMMSSTDSAPPEDYSIEPGHSNSKTPLLHLGPSSSLLPSHLKD